MAKKALKLDREPENTQAAIVKRYSRDDLLDTLNPVLDWGKSELELHQLASLLLGIHNSSWFFALDMGTGKTVIALYTFLARKLMGQAVQVLVTSPPIVLHHWEREVIKHTTLTVDIVDGTPADKLRTLMDSTSDVVVVSHPWLTRLFSDVHRRKLKYDKVAKALKRFDMLVVDEAHVLQNSTSKGFKGYVEFLIDIPYKYLLTGTPIGNSYTGVWTLYYLLDQGATYGQNYSDFLRRWFKVFMVKDRFPVYTLKKQKKAEFFDLFWNRAIRYEEQECNDLPEKLYNVVPLAMTPQQQRLYDELLERDTDEDVETVATDFMRVTGGVHSELKNVPTTKLLALEYYINEFVITRGEQVIIWHWLVDEGRLIVEFIKKKFPKLVIAEARGETNKNAIEKGLALWRKRKAHILVGNVKSIGVGVDLYESRLAIYYSNSRGIIDRNQSEKRIHRPGQTQRCIYIDVVCEDSIDDYILGNLRKAMNAFEGFTGDGLRANLRRLRKERRK